jgi:hypothetical protein
MLNYSELSKPQQAIIKAMRQGYELKWHKDIGQFRIHGNGLPYKVATSSVDSLINRHYIEECFRDNETILYYINIELLTSENLKAMEK